MSGRRWVLSTRRTSGSSAASRRGERTALGASKVCTTLARSLSHAGADIKPHIPRVTPVVVHEGAAAALIQYWPGPLAPVRGAASARVRHSSGEGLPIATAQAT